MLKRLLRFSSTHHTDTVSFWAPVWAILVLIGVWTAWSAYVDYQQVMQQEYRLLEMRARQREARLSGALRNVKLVLNAVLEDLRERPAMPVAELNQLLRRYLGQLPELRNLLLVDGTGHIRAEAREMSIGKDVREREYFQHHSAHPEVESDFISKPFTTLAGLTGTTLSRSVTDNRGGFSGVVIASIESGFFDASMRAVTPEATLEALLLHRDGDIIGQAPQPELVGKDLKGGIAYAEHMASGKQTTRHLNQVKFGGVKKMSVFHDLAEAPLTVVVSRHHDAVLAEWTKSLVGHAARSLLLAVSVLFFAGLARRRQLALIAVQRQMTDATQELRNFKAIVDHTDDAVISKNLQGVVKTWNRGAEKIFGYSAQEAIGQQLQTMYPPDRLQEQADMLERISHGQRVEHFDTVRCHKSGRLIDISATISPIIGENDAVIGVSMIARDISEHKIVENRIGFMASHDRLTELPNRDLFYDRLSQSISLARRKHLQLAILFLDLDGFKNVNDCYGHEAGDATLKEAARRLQVCMRDMDTVARLGGDEFAIILNEIGSTNDVAGVAQKIIDTLSAPMALADGTAYGVGVSIGIALYPECGSEIDRLMHSADRAMYECKVRGKNCFSFYRAPSPSQAGEESWIQFDEAHLVGVAQIDAEHQRIADLLNQLNTDLGTYVPHGQVMVRLDAIAAMVASHFGTENRLMKESGYPDATEHMRQHVQLLNEMKYLKQRFSQGGELVVLQWIKDWFVGHISGADKPLGTYLNGRSIR